VDCTGLVGRTPELERLRQIRRSPLPGSAVIAGPAGVGKSRLARFVLDEARRDGWATLTIRGRAGLGGSPFVALQSVMDVPTSGSLGDLTTCIEKQLLEMRTARGLLLVADDCQELDEPSADLLYRLVAGGSIFSILTAGSATCLPSAFVDLYTQGFAERIELANLTLAASTELLSANLGGPVQDSSAYWMWQATAGNPLYLREVMLSSIETGALSEQDGEWRWRGEWARGARLQEIVSARLGRLAPDEIEALETLAFTGSIPLELLTSVLSRRVIEHLERRSLVIVEQSGSRLAVAIANPLHAKVLRHSMSPLRQRGIRQSLVDALRRGGASRASDRARLACWSLEPGLELDAATLRLSARASLFPIGPALAANLYDLVPEVPVATSRAKQAVPLDVDLAVRLARTAYDSEAGILAASALVGILVTTGRIDEAESVLADVAPLATSSGDRLRLAMARTSIQFWGRRCVSEDPTEGLVAALNECSSHPDRTLRADAYEAMADIELHLGHPAAALANGQQSAAVARIDLSKCRAARVIAPALVMLGRCNEAIDLIDEALMVTSAPEDHGSLVADLLFARAGTLSWLGRNEQARRLAESARDVALSVGDSVGVAAFGILSGMILLRQGRPTSAARLLSDAAALLGERDPRGFRPWALYGLALARVESGDGEGAAAALAEGRRLQLFPRPFDTVGCLAEVLLHQRARRTNVAIEVARRGAERARARGLVNDEALILDAWVQVEPSDAVAERLTAVAGRTDSNLVAALARRAQALVAEDANGLLAAAEELAGACAWGMAAAAAAAAAGIHSRRGRVRAAQAATRIAGSYAERCEMPLSLIAPAVVVPAGLTRRELDVVELAATGLSSKDIASRLYLSVRTVENYIYHACIKLGVSDRAEMARACQFPSRHGAVQAALC
jgi:DNA-binding NarL/FixJ family response regulator